MGLSGASSAKGKPSKSTSDRLDEIFDLIADGKAVPFSFVEDLAINEPARGRLLIFLASKGYVKHDRSARFIQQG